MEEIIYFFKLNLAVKIQKSLKLSYKNPSLLQKMMTRDSLFKRSDLWDERCSIVWDKSCAIREALRLMYSTSRFIIIILSVNGKYFFSSEFVPQSASHLWNTVSM